MIAFLGEVMFSPRDDFGEPESGIKENDLDKIDIMPRQRTDEVSVGWK